MEGMLEAAVAEKVAVVAPLGTVTEAATGSKVLLLASATGDPVEGAALERVMVQEVAPPALSEVGLQASDETRTGATRLMVAVFDWPFKVAVMVAD